MSVLPNKKPSPKAPAAPAGPAPSGALRRQRLLELLRELGQGYFLLLLIGSVCILVLVIVMLIV